MAAAGSEIWARQSTLVPFRFGLRPANVKQTKVLSSKHQLTTKSGTCITS